MDSSTSTIGSRRGRRPIAAALTALGVCLLLFLGGFFVGRRDLSAARAEIARNKTESAKRQAQAEAEIQKAQARLSSEQALARLAAARSLLYRSAVELDRRNFGTAQTYLKAAAEIVEKDEPAAGLSSTQAQKLKAAVSGISLTVSSDTALQRGQILDAAEEMNQVLDPLQSREARE